MNTGRQFVVAMVAPFAFAGTAAVLADHLGTAFTYQGELLQAGILVNGTCDFQFSLWDMDAGGTQQGGTLTPTVNVTDGRFTIALDFGDDRFEGAPRFLEIAVCCPSVCTPGAPMAPRQELTPTPYALALPALRNTPSGDVGFPDSPNVIGGHHSNSIDASVGGAIIAGGGESTANDPMTANFVFDNYDTIGGGGNNKAGTDDADPTTAPYATVGGGDRNTASGSESTAAGGTGNMASGGLSFIGGGFENTASGQASVVSGGWENAANGQWATVGGGEHNFASGFSATVPGGRGNTASGSYSFAAGRRARPSHNGTFVWADSTTPAGGFVSTGSDQFLISAQGGVGINTNEPTDTLTVHGSGIAFKTTPAGDLRVRITGTAAFPGFVGTTGPNLTPNIWLTGTAVSTNTGHIELFNPAGDPNIRLSSSIASNFTGAADFWGANGVRNIILSHLVGSPNNGFVAVYDAAEALQAALWVDAAGDGQVFSHDGTFTGDVAITGAMTAGAKAFKMDHPLDPANKYLYHSTVESPDMMNVYNGNVVTDANGEVGVELPAYFEALNKDFRYQLTVIGQFAQAIVGTKIKANRFSIRTDKPNVEVSWQVTGVRKDAFAEAHRIVVEVDKVEQELGRYLHPEVFGQPPEMRIPDISAQASPPAPAAAAGPVGAGPAPVPPIDPKADLEQ